MSLPDKNENYKDVEYWDQRYANEDSYEWCKDFRFFKPLLHDAAPNKNLKILVIGKIWIESVGSIYRDSI